MIDTAELNARMSDFTLARLESLGEVAGGLQNYYSYLAKKGTILRKEEIAVADYIDTLKPSNVIELCCGGAQLAHLLTLRGHKTEAAELNFLRVQYAQALGQHVGSDCRIHCDFWQAIDLSRFGLVVTINAASSFTGAKDVPKLLRYAAGGGQFIIRPRQFGTDGIDVELPGLQATKVHNDIWHYRTAG